MGDYQTCNECRMNLHSDCYSKNQWHTRGDLMRCEDCLDASLGNKRARTRSPSPPPRETADCSVCGDSLDVDDFSNNQWAKGQDRSCPDCVDRAVAQRERAARARSPSPPARQTAECSACGHRRDADDFSNSQWAKGADRSCRNCVDQAVAQKQQATLTRLCLGCGRSQTRDNFSRTQWKEKATAETRCLTCVHEGVWSKEALRSSARTNDGAKAEFEQAVYAQGSFRNVWRGRYTSGRRTGQHCVRKRFKPEFAALEAAYQTADQRVVSETIAIVDAYNREDLLDKVVRVNQTALWKDTDGKMSEVEPFIEGWTKFNSNSGWARDDTPWDQVMQALSHFSYHRSGGQRLLCDLQGGTNAHGALITDPAVMTHEPGTNGPTDLGFKGMHSFFASHQCNQYCRSAWLSVPNAQRFHPKKKGSSMEHVSTAANPKHPGSIRGFALPANFNSFKEEDEDDY